MKYRSIQHDPIALAYSGGQIGGASLPYFQGGRQYGAGWLRTIARMVFPIAKQALGMVGNVAANTARDLIDDRKGFKQSIKDNAMSEATRLVGNVASNSFGNKRKASSINKPRVKVTKKHHTIFGRY